jgi:hypothetical protein
MKVARHTVFLSLGLAAFAALTFLEAGRHHGGRDPRVCSERRPDGRIGDAK